METLTLVLSIIEVILAAFVVVVVMFQSSKRAGLSGAIAGGADTFFGKNKSRSRDAKLHRLTVIAGILLAINTMLLNIF